MASNHDDVVDQLTDAGLLVDRLVVGKMQRCRIEGDRERRGWYVLHELTLDGGDVVLVGSYGIWQGDDNGARKILLQKRTLTDDQKAAIRTRLAEDRKRADAQRRAEAKRAAERAEAAWRKCQVDGDSDYLTRKGVRAHGVRFSPTGAVVVPMMDTGGRVHGLQFILTRKAHADRIKRTGRDKEFWPAGLSKRGHFHLIGLPTWILLIAEGYATAASLHEATGLPVAVAFDAGNLQPVAEALHKRYPKARILVCADDDAFGKCKHCGEPVHTGKPSEPCPKCDKPHERENAGRARASAAALAVGGQWIAPRFAADAARWERFVAQGHKITDFNDLHVLESLPSVRQQIDDALRTFGWTAPAAAAEVVATGGEGSDKLRPIDTLDELLERFALVYGQKGTVFDHQEHMLVALSDMRDACISRELHRRWAEHPGRKLVRVQEVGFDPAHEDPNITCNLWDRWPTTPKPGTCERLLELLRYMCAADDNAQALYEWVLHWIAYPIQHPGAKMKTTLVIHGPQGTGKNLFFECVMAMYGRYGRCIDQSAIEDKFNDWASRKLFLIADEVVARSDLYHVKNKLKAFISGDWIRINPKNMAAYDERNHVNLVFLSNERMPVVLEEDDRRHAVIWTPEKLSPAFYDEVAAEIAAGGIEALHHHLLQIDLKGFNPHTKPPMTQAKADLIELSLDSTNRFYNHWTQGEIDGVRLMPALSEDLFDLYRAWCQRQGISKAAPLNKLIDAIGKKKDMLLARKRYLNGSGLTNPKGFVIPQKSAVQMPPGSSETAWLGECAVAFRNAVSDYKGANHG